MKKTTYLIQCLMLITMAWSLTACEKIVFPDAETVENHSMLQIRTRAEGTGEDAIVSYPVQVYVFNGNKCEAVQTIKNEQQTLNIALVEGTYTVYAIGGASAENYVLPSKEEAVPELPIVLREGRNHEDLMVATDQVTLVDGGTNTLTLSLKRKVLLLQSVSVKNVPVAATAVSVTILPLWTSLLGTEYAGESGEETIHLTKQSNGKTWAFTDSRYLLPSSDSPTTIKINITKPEGISTYTYTTTTPLKAGSKINIQSTYTEAIGVTLTGVITGDSWGEEKTISFDFDENGSMTADTENKNENTGNNDDNNDVLTGSIPAVGSTYQTCYVVSVKENNGIAEVLLLSPKQKTMTEFTSGISADNAMSLIEAALPTCAVDGISGWRLMKKDEIEIVRTKSNIPNLETDGRYLYLNSSGVLRIGKFGSTQITEGFSFQNTDLLRPVTTIKIRKN